MFLRGFGPVKFLLENILFLKRVKKGKKDRGTKDKPVTV